MILEFRQLGRLQHLPIVGRVAAKGLADELHDRRYLIIDGIDSRAHYLVLPDQTDDEELQIGAIAT